MTPTIASKDYKEKEAQAVQGDWTQSLQPQVKPVEVPEEVKVAMEQETGGKNLTGEKNLADMTREEMLGELVGFLVSFIAERDADGNLIGLRVDGKSTSKEWRAVGGAGDAPVWKVVSWEEQEK